MIKLNKIHHVSIICSDYEASKIFYTEILGLKIVRETFRETRLSYKLDLSLGANYILELFSFPSPPMRPSYPESTGLRHIAFEVDDLLITISELKKMNIPVENIRTDEITGKRFTFISDPDQLPIELYEK